MEKQAFALIKVLKQFRAYILNSEMTAHVRHLVVKDILVQQDPAG
jgi:hypothetical protein